MRPHDQQRFAEFVAEFLDGCGIEPPFHLVCIDASGSVSVSRHIDDDNVDEVCRCQHTPGGFVPPMVLTIIAPDGRSKSVRIEIVAGRGLRMM